MGGGSFVKVADQNSPPYFHWTNYTLNKTPPIFYFFPYFSIYTFYKTFSLERKETQNREKNLSQKLEGNLSLKLGGSCA